VESKKSKRIQDQRAKAMPKLGSDKRLMIRLCLQAGKRKILIFICHKMVM